MNKTKIISFRVKPKEKEYLSLLAKYEEVRLSEFIRDILKGRIVKENFNKKEPNN